MWVYVSLAQRWQTLHAIVVEYQINIKSSVSVTMCCWRSTRQSLVQVPWWTFQGCQLKLFQIAFVIISITMKPHELCHHWILIYSNGSVEFPYLPAVPISHVAQLIYAHSIVWICYDQAHENSTCLYLRFQIPKPGIGVWNRKYAAYMRPTKIVNTCVHNLYVRERR